MLLLALSIAPGLAIILYIYGKDSYDREPRRYLLVSFLLGMASVIPAFVLEKAGEWAFGGTGPASSIGYTAFFAFIIVGCSEELSKYAVVRWYAWPKKEFDEPFDGIVYSVMVAMGFATIENIGYVQDHGFSTAIVRMFLSVPAHAAFGTVMGYYIGLAKFNRARAGWFILKGLAMAVFFHGAFDFFLFLQGNIAVRAYVSEGLLFFGAVASYYFAVRFSLRAIRLHSEISRIDFEKKNNQV